MTDFSHNLDGLADQVEDLEAEADAWSGGSTWHVGTAVEYAVYLEFGTRHMDPKPFFRPVLHEAEARGVDGFIDAHTRTTIDDIDDIDELVQTLALAMERRLKQVITRKGLIDTGTLRASVKAVQGSPSQLPDAGEVDADAEASFEVNA